MTRHADTAERRQKIFGVGLNKTSTSSLGGFNGLPVPDAAFPNVNRTDPHRKRLNQAINTIFEPCYRAFSALTPTDTVKRM